MSNSDWQKLLIEYLENPTGLTDLKIKYGVLNYIIIGKKLFKKTHEGVLLKCLSKNEAYLVISSVHSGSCGAHQTGHKMKWLLFRQGVYWSTIIKDCNEFSEGCQESQRHANIQHVSASELHSIIKPWPFRGWDLELVGEIRPSSSKDQWYILVGINYFTMWVEAIPLVNVDQEAVIYFIQSHIIHKFGILETIMTEQGSIFTGKKCRNFLLK